ncbi:MAG: OmpA family protein [Bacteroidota bacterium]
MVALLLSAYTIHAQYDIEGYIFESGNRGFIADAEVTISNMAETEYYGQMITDASGAYKFRVARAGEYLLRVDKAPYFDYQEVVTIADDSPQTIYLKHEVQRSPGYIFEITLAEKDPAPEAPRDALKGALVEVYNNTKKRETLVIPALETPDFKVDLIKGNHYTILIRKADFLSKRMEAFVDVEGCILCFEGIGSVSPGVSDNLSENNNIGVLLANVEMDRLFEGKVIGLNDIYYDFGKSDITKKAAQELNKVAELMRDNPNISIELGSHTDSRGKAKGNLKLSESRARSAVEYLVERKGIPVNRISARGYGETQLVNNCSDGVDCSDADHQKNRRTELKILDVGAMTLQRSLRQMKADELMDEFLADIEGAGQVKVADEEELASIVKQDEMVIEERTSSRVFEDVSEGNKRLSKNAQSADEVEIEVVDKASEDETAVESNDTDTLDNSAQPSTTQMATEEMIQQRRAEIADRQRAAKDDLEDAADEMLEETEVEKSDSSTEVIDFAGTTASTEITESFTGFKVAVMYSRFELPAEHSIFSEFDDIVIYTTADNNKLYLTGTYKDLPEAKAGQSSLKKEYPQSYVVGFKNGIRIY